MIVDEKEVVEEASDVIDMEGHRHLRHGRMHKTQQPVDLVGKHEEAASVHDSAGQGEAVVGTGMAEEDHRVGDGHLLAIPSDASLAAHYECDDHASLCPARAHDAFRVAADADRDPSAKGLCVFVGVHVEPGVVHVEILVWNIRIDKFCSICDISKRLVATKEFK